MPEVARLFQSLTHGMFDMGGKKADQLAATATKTTAPTAGQVLGKDVTNFASAKPISPIEQAELDLDKGLAKAKIKVPISLRAQATAPDADLDAPRFSRQGDKFTYLECKPSAIPQWLSNLFGVTDKAVDRHAFVSLADESAYPVKVAGAFAHGVVEPTFNPAGDKVMYAQLKNYPGMGPNGFGEGLKQTRLDMVDLKTKKVVTVYNGSLSMLHPQFSPDGRYVATYSRDPGRQGIYLIDMEHLDKEPKRLIDTPYDDKHPVWSDDGKKIFFHNQNGGDAVVNRNNPVEQAWVGYIDMSNPAKPTRVMLDDTSKPAYHKHPAPMPGTNFITFHDGKKKLELMDITTKQRVHLDLDGLTPTQSPMGEYKHGTFSADGSSFGFLAKAKKADVRHTGQPNTYALYTVPTSSFKSAFDEALGNGNAAPAAAK